MKMLTMLSLCLASLTCTPIQAAKGYRLNWEFKAPPGYALMVWRPENALVFYEIVYNGFSGSTIALEYREHSYEYRTNVVATQQLSFDIARDSTLVVRDVKIRVLSVDNTGIRYIILNDPPGMEKK